MNRSAIFTNLYSELYLGLVLENEKALIVLRTDDSGQMFRWRFEVFILITHNTVCTMQAVYFYARVMGAQRMRHLERRCKNADNRYESNRHEHKGYDKAVRLQDSRCPGKVWLQYPAGYLQMDARRCCADYRQYDHLS